MGRGLRALPSAQSDGHKPIPHIITGAASVLLTLALSYFAHFGGVGPVGPTGPAGKAPTGVGVCAYFGKDPNGHTRFQLFSPAANGTCSKGYLVSAEPGH